MLLPNTNTMGICALYSIWPKILDGVIVFVYELFFAINLFFMAYMDFKHVYKFWFVLLKQLESLSLVWCPSYCLDSIAWTRLLAM